MNSQPTHGSLKVCPRCAVASRTDSETCPECGRRYRRRSWPLLAVVIVAAAFGLGYGGRLLLEGSDSGASVDSVTLGQAEAVPLEISRRQLGQRLQGASPVTTRQRPHRETCLYYGLANHPEDAWVFCFRNDRLVTSTVASALTSAQ